MDMNEVKYGTVFCLAAIIAAAIGTLNANHKHNPPLITAFAVFVIAICAIAIIAQFMDTGLAMYNN